jgi:hypothetical protein
VPFSSGVVPHGILIARSASLARLWLGGKASGCGTIGGMVDPWLARTIGARRGRARALPGCARLGGSFAGRRFPLRGYSGERRREGIGGRRGAERKRRAA